MSLSCSLPSPQPYRLHLTQQMDDIIIARSNIQNILLVVPSASPASDIDIGGVFHTTEQPISFPTIAEDLKIVYPAIKDVISSDPALELAFYTTNATGQALILHESDFGGARPEIPNGEETLRLGVILHRRTACVQQRTRRQRKIGTGGSIQSHIEAGCCEPFSDNFDSESIGYLPSDLTLASDSTEDSHSGEPSTPTSRSRTKRLESKKSHRASSSPLRFVREDAQPFLFEDCVKMRYSKCVVSSQESRFGLLPCGPGFEAAKIVPQKLWFAYPTMPSTPSLDVTTNNAPPPPPCSLKGLRDQYTRSWRGANGLLLRGDIRTAFERRLLAIHPVDLRVRLFAPMSAYTYLHGKKIQLPPRIDREALKFHYRQCVIENLAANMFLFQDDLRIPYYRALLDRARALLPDLLSTLEVEELSGDARGGDSAWDNMSLFGDEYASD